MAFTRDGVELARSFLKETSKRHQIEAAYLFGSYAIGTQKDYSDIDIAVIFGKTPQISMLEVICFREDEFKSEGTAIITLIKKEGMKIELS